LKYNSERLREQLISRLNDKFISAARAYLDLLYSELVEKLYSIDKRFESQRATRESWKLLSIPLSSKPTDKPSGTRDNCPTLTVPSTTSKRILIRTRVEFDALH